jgi:KDO2-lipid IV(A) lauroyltransferase
VWRSAAAPAEQLDRERDRGQRTCHEGGPTHRSALLDAEAAGDSEQVITDLTQRCTAAIEAAVRVAPEQWLWVHNRWRTKPPAPEKVQR